ncbi:unnamed protein product [Nippostrongylus brasiliensis]|uniref:Uncharacterized protein n=1 Tax=Nippostrongylus brasiliensis TaxID=27835 RepID=A0A0N4YCS5_NIPBR|nr:unnamed protein product [Nippostrongylus brasiliensis]
MFMRNGYVSDAPFSLNGTNISECSSYVYLGREVTMTNDLSPELGRRKRAAWGAFKSVEEVVGKTKNARLRDHLFDSTVLPALPYTSESWALRKQDEHAICVAQRSIERRMLGVIHFIQARDGIRSSELRRQSKIRDAVAKISDNTEFEDFYVASEICSAFLMSSALSTFGWWLAFFTRNQSTVYYANDKRVVNDDHPNLTEFFL